MLLPAVVARARKKKQQRSKIFSSISCHSLSMEITEKPIRLIVGLGNPGCKYKYTRHNVGFFLLDEMAKRIDVKWKSKSSWMAEYGEFFSAGRKIFLLKPQTFMNLSGTAVRKCAEYFKISKEEILVVVDDVSMPFGLVKATVRPGTAGHNGLESIANSLGLGFMRYRIGVGSEVQKVIAIKDFVLSSFTEEEKGFLSKNIEIFLKNIEVLIDKGMSKGMNWIKQPNYIL